MDVTESFPLMYRVFSTANGPDDTGLFTFAGTAYGHSDGTKFAFNFKSENGIGKATKIEKSDVLFPISDIEKEYHWDSKSHDSIGGNGYLLHSRTQDCTNATMRLILER